MNSENKSQRKQNKNSVRIDDLETRKNPRGGDNKTTTNPGTKTTTTKPDQPTQSISLAFTKVEVSYD